MSVTREELYEQVWAEPMLDVAAKYKVSSSFMARVCERLNVPRPPRGYWAELRAGHSPRRPALPPARRGDELVWRRDGGYRVYAQDTPTAPTAPSRVRQSRRRNRPALHPLLSEARELYDAAGLNESGYIHPGKRMLVDLFVSRAMLETALQNTNKLFFALEDRGYEVVLAPNGQGLQRAECEVRERGGKPYWGFRFWKPNRPTVVYIGTVAFGLTIFEMTEEAKVRYLDGKCVRESELSPADRRRSKERTETEWMSTRDMPTGRLCLKAFSPYAGVEWQKQWPEKVSGQLVAKIPEIVRELEGAAGPIAAQVTERERLAEIERQKWQAEYELWVAGQPERDRQEAEKRRAENTKQSREQLLSLMETWATAKARMQFLDELAAAADYLPAVQRAALLERLKKARELVGSTDVLKHFGAWRAPDER